MEAPYKKSSILPAVASVFFGILICIHIDGCDRQIDYSAERIEYIKEIEYQKGFVDGFRANDDGSILINTITTNKPNHEERKQTQPTSVNRP